MFWCVLCCYLCLFDCKCNSLNRLGENIQTKTKKKNIKTKSFEKNINTEIQGIQPRTQPRINIISTANKYLSGSGWMSCIFVVFVFLKGVLLLFCVYYSLFRLYMQQLKKTRQTKENLREKQKTTKHTARPAGTWKIYIRGRVVGWRMSCIFVFVVSLMLFVVFLFVCFCLVFLSCCMYKRNNSSNNKQHKITYF